MNETTLNSSPVPLATLLQLAPLLVLRVILPLLPTAMAVVPLRSTSRKSSPGVPEPLFQLTPLLLLYLIVPLLPAAMAVEPLITTLLRSFEVPLERSVQLAPVSLLWAISPLSPTATTLDPSRASANSFFSPPSVRTVLQLAPLFVLLAPFGAFGPVNPIIGAAGDLAAPAHGDDRGSGEGHREILFSGPEAASRPAGTPVGAVGETFADGGGVTRVQVDHGIVFIAANADVGPGLCLEVAGIEPQKADRGKEQNRNQS